MVSVYIVGCMRMPFMYHYSNIPLISSFCMNFEERLPLGIIHINDLHASLFRLVSDLALRGPVLRFHPVVSSIGASSTPGLKE